MSDDDRPTWDEAFADRLGDAARGVYSLRSTGEARREWTTDGRPRPVWIATVPN